MVLVCARGDGDITTIGRKMRHASWPSLFGFASEPFIYRDEELAGVSGLAERIPSWFASAVSRYLTPEIMRIVDERVTRSEDALKELMNARFATLDAKIDGLEKRLDLVQRVALLEAKVREIEAKR